MHGTQARKDAQGRYKSQFFLGGGEGLDLLKFEAQQHTETNATSLT